jgi:murein DD-endopeptidase MepM/ murein hydrolase activator NlpD
MKSKRWTFLYVPSGHGGVRTVHVDKRLAWAVACAATLLLLLVSSFTVSYTRQRLILQRLDRRNAEIATLRAQIADLESMSQSYQVEMAESLRLQERANLIAGLEVADADLAAPGLGGSEPEDEVVGIGYDRLSQQRLAELRTQLDRLLVQARYQRAGYERVLQVLREDQELREATPSIRPLRGGWMSSRYGRRVDPFTGSLAFHRGLDFSAHTGTPVYATASGTVVGALRDGSLGNCVEIDHGNGFLTRYGHMRSTAVRSGQRVSRGDVIGYVGNTGRSTNPHLHYEVVQNGRSENPALYIIPD